MKKIIVIMLLITFMIIMPACNKEKEISKKEVIIPGDIVQKNSINDDYAFFQEKTAKTYGQSYTEGKVKYPNSLWDSPKFEYDISLNPSEFPEIKAFFMESPIKYNNKTPKIFGYIGFPKGASKEAKVPAVVLVHGGLGTAFPDWVNMWNEAGYAAIAIDTEGGQPLPNNNMDTGLHLERNKYDADSIYTAPPTNGVFNDLNKPIEEQWIYQATSSVILANSLISSFDEVDNTKVGITGVSWGGLLTSVITGYDDRFAFSIPVYGTLELYKKSCAQFSEVHKTQENADLWDTAKVLKDSMTPMLIINSDEDFAFSIDASSATYLSKPVNTFMCISHKYQHSQRLGATHSSIIDFANKAIGKNDNFVKIIKEPTKTDASIKFINKSNIKIKSVTLYTTNSDNVMKDCGWLAYNFPKFKSGELKINLNKKVKNYYVEIGYEEKGDSTTIRYLTSNIVNI